MNAYPVTSADESWRDGAQQALSSYEAAHAWAFSWVSATQRLGELAARAAQTLITEQRAISLAMLDERSPFGVWRLQTGYALTGTAKSVAYARHASEIVLGTIADAVTDAESRISRNFFGATEALEHAANDTSTIVSAQAAASRAVTGSAERIVDASGNALPPERAS